MTPRVPDYLAAAIAVARGLNLDDRTDADLAKLLGIPKPRVRRIRKEVRQGQLPLQASVEERHRERVRSALARFEQRRGRRRR